MHVLLLLLCCCLGIREAAARKHHGPNRVSSMFQFTQPSYNMTLMEAVRGRVLSEQGQTTRVGVVLPVPDAKIKFKIVEGDKQRSFEAQHQIVGDFAFFRIRHGLLNREVRDSYDLVVKAICRRCNNANLETTARVHIRVNDLNDVWPFFAQPSYTASIDTNTPQFAQILQVNASDADVGLNGELYFSLKERSPHFHVDPVSGWIRVLSSPPKGTYTLVVQAEDRASRLFSVAPRFPGGITATVTIEVHEAEKPQVRIEAELGKIQASRGAQVAAILRVSQVPEGLAELIIANDDAPFLLLREKPSRSTWMLKFLGPSQSDRLQVDLFAWDVSRVGRNASKQISIDVERDSTVSFTPLPTVYYVNDSVPVNYVIGRFEAHSILRTDTVIYELASKEALPFLLNEKTGVLRVKDKLEKENYKFTIRAKISDSKQEAELRVEVVIHRTNRVAPKWTEFEEKKISLPKDYENFEIVDLEAKDEDGDRVVFMLANEMDEKVKQYFGVDHLTGKVSIIKKLPASPKAWNLSIDAFDNGWPLPRFSRIELILSLNHTELTITGKPITTPKISNSPPVFDALSSGLIQVDEDTPIGSTVTTIYARDPDFGYSGLVHYSTNDDFFTVDALTGVITVLSDLAAIFDQHPASKMDYIDYELTVTASDRNDPPATTSQKLKIRINDANNHAPVFEKNHYHAVIPENVLPGEKLLIVSATDADYGRNGKVEYRIASVDDRLAIDPDSGVVTVLGKFDREDSSENVFTLMAIDRGNPPNFAFVNFTVSLEDVNDNAPKCHSLNQKMSIPEDWPNRALVGCVAASDADIGDNGRLNFGLTSGGEKLPFSIDRSSGCLFVDSEKTLDYETRALYNLSVDVSDNGNPFLSTTCHVVVELSDVNENLNPPRFGDSDMVYDVTVNENLPEGTEVLKLKATDQDNPNEEIRYSIIGGSGLGLFEINENGVIRTNAILDREQNSHFWLTVSAEDSAVVPLSSVAHVFVKVADQNDHLPHIKEPIYFASIPENSVENTVVVKVEAWDVDEQPKTKNGADLRYSIVKGNPQSHFRVDDNTGYVVTGQRKLDRERQSEHELHVQVCDQAQSPLCNTVIVVVNVSDLNDNAPVFAQAVYNINVQAGVTGVVGRVYASDFDEGINAEIDYSVKPKGFTIDHLGQISTKKPIKAGEQIALQVTATDRGMPSLSTNTSVILTAVENGPKKKNRSPKLVNVPTELTISDKEAVGTTVTLLEATDADGDHLFWKLENFTEFFALRVDHGGLEVAKSLRLLPAETSKILLGFSVTDGLSTVAGSVSLKISRSSNAKPFFDRSHYDVEISEKIPVGTTFFSVKATTIPKEEVIYSIHSVDNVAAGERLRIEQTTGNLIAIEPFDGQVSRNFSVVVLARSGGGVNATMVNVDLREENDSAPRFLKPGYIVSLDSSRAVKGAELIRVHAHDSDSNANGVVKYSIASGNENGLFEIDPVEGTIKLTRDANNFVEALLTIRATDSGAFPMSSTTTVRLISMENSYNSTVEFSRGVYQSTIKTTSKFGDVILVVNAESSSTVYYNLNPECKELEVHRASGAVTLAKKLFQKETITCNVTAKTTWGRQNHAKIVVKVVAGNEHAPSFNSTVYYAYIQENATNGSPVFFENTTSPLIVHAYDADHGPNGMVNYRIISPNEPYFTVDFVSGAVRAVKPIDYAQHEKWSFYVQASDMGNPPRSATVPALVIVRIVDINNIAPKIVSPVSGSQIILHLPTVSGFEVARIEAVDEDTVGKLRYSMTPSPLFFIGAHDGVVTVVGNNTELGKASSFDLHFIVSDGIQSAHSDVKITVANLTINRDSLHFGEQVYRIDVVENATTKGPTKLFTARAKGLLPGETICYHISNPQSQFSIDSASGILSLKEGVVLDREETPQLELLIEAKSSKNHQRYCRCVLVINVVDVNDSPPQFINTPYDAVISQDSKVGEKILSVKAIDADHGMNGLVRYKLGKDAPSFLKINKFDGRITIAKAVPSAAMTSKLEFTVEALDQGSEPLKSEEKVVLQFVDRSTPIFSHSKYLAHVSEDAPTGTVVATVRALSNVGGTIMFVIREGDAQKHFEIGTESGLITVRKNGLIDRENIKDYSLTVAAIDVTRSNISATTSVKITVDDVNDNPPKFDRPLYHISVNEATHVGTVLTTVTATDPDDGESNIAYMIVGPNATVATVDDAGQIQLAKQLDYEEVREYRFRIRASDEDQLASEAWLQITVEDANDHAPFFKQPYVKLTLFDDLKAGQFVAHMNAEDVDTVTNLPDGARFLYSVIDGDETLFTLDHHTGVVRLARPVESEDLEFDRVKRLNVSVSDGLYTAYGHLEVTFSISGALWPPPRFRQSVYSASVKENRPITNSTAIAVVEAVGGLPPIRYSMGGTTQPEDPTWPVYVDEHSGRIYARDVLDYEKQQVWRLPLVARDARQRSAFSTLVLHVLDANDNAPEFIGSTGGIEVSVNAGITVGELVAVVMAVDKDENDQVEYSIVADDSKSARYFTIHPRQGLITLRKSLAKVEGEKLTFFVRASDLANPPHQSEMQVTVKVVGNGVEVVRFGMSHYFFTVDEEAQIGTVVGWLQIDQNYSNSKVQFSIASPSDNIPFSLDSAKGRLIVSQKLDRERQDVYRFLVRLTSENKAEQVAVCTIRLTDVNDNAPVFQGIYDSLSVTEDAPVGTSIAVFSATDRDQGPNSRIYFSINEQEAAPFHMDRETGWLMVKDELDREQKDQYKLKVLATDEGGLSSKYDVTVNVKDINDSPPVFDKESYDVSLDLDKASKGQEVLKPKITDDDLPPNNEIELSLIEGNNFGLFNVSGHTILLAKDPPKTLQKRIELKLLAFDGKHSTETKVYVKLKSVTKDPCKSGQKTLKIKEDSPRGTKIAKLQGLGFNISGDDFTVVGEHLVVSKELDYERRKSYDLVLVKAKGTFCVQEFKVLIEDVNDNAPKFTHSQYNATVKENLNATVYLLRVEAIDPESTVTYSLKEDYDGFEIDAETGAIRATRPFDREEKSLYVLEVMAKDSENLSDRTTVHVQVADENDNAPVFEKKEHRVQMLESEKVGFALLRVKAVDVDNHNHQITYTMKEPHPHFEIDDKAGQITLKKEIDFEVTPEVVFFVVASDNGQPPLSTEAKITVEVLDVNDNAPKFASKEFHGKIEENIRIGSKVLKVEAHDADSAHYGSVAYRIHGEEGDVFEIVEGQILTKTEIDYESKKSYEFVVEASDGGEPPLKANTTVKITVLDVNDNHPQFEICNLTAVIQEGTDPKLPLLQMVVLDKDGAGNGAPFRVELSGEGSDRFSMDKNLNLFHKSKKLTKKTYKLTATAYDAGNLSSQCPVTVYVKEQSRHPPTVSSMVITLNTVMGEFLGGRIGVVKAEDRDKGDMLRYSIRPDVEGFRIDPDSGALIAQPDLLAGIYRLNVTVTDGKYNVGAPVIVDVSSVDQDALDHSISIRVKNMNGARFLENHMEAFHKTVAKHLNVQPTHVRILSLQEIPADRHHSHRLRYRKRRNMEKGSTDLEVLFTVSRGDARGYLRPIHVRQRLEQSAVDISDSSNLEIISLTTEVCRRDLCVKGECRDRLWLESSGDFTEYDTFISPRHKRTFECICKEGYGGRRCDVAVDRCSREQCSKEEMCISTVEEPGFRCVCPPGRKGERCAEMACEGERDCSQTAELSVAGDGYVHMTISTSLERRLELSVELKTLSMDSTIMHARGKSDFHQIRLVDGYAEYRWDCGTGEGVARVPHLRISDGKWHVLKVSRRGRHSRLTVDDTFSGEGYSPPGSDVLNLYSSGMTLVLGARVEYQNEVLHDVFSVVPFEHQTAGDVAQKVIDGITACFRRISIDGLTLPKTRQGIRLHNVNIGCAALDANPCSSQPCQNDATCSADPTSVTGFKCHCSARFSGSTCEIDLNACASNPCPNGVACQSLFNDFLCMCPPGFSGKTCQHRGQWNPCASSPCGPYGQCYPNHFSQTGYECLCARGYTGMNCSTKIPDLLAHFWPLSLIELVAVIAVVCLLIAIIILTICICRKKSADERKVSAEIKEDDVRHSLIHKPAPPTDSPPPLPPRSYRPQFSNLESAQLTGLPTVQVRPLPTHERLSSGGRCDSRSPSLADSAHSNWRKSTRNGSTNLDAARHYGSAADDLEQLGRLGILRRYDRAVPEHTNGAFSSSSALGDSIQCLPTTEEAIPNIDRIDDAVDAAIEFRNERLKLEQLTNNANEDPVLEESDYMTMRPIKRRSQLHDSCESQRRPLLEATSDSDGGGTATTDVDFVYPPKPPKHGAAPPLYDNPASEAADKR
ncbi:hypothetical protein QR680_012137 [Steinernema hermaphroditum]|uniref:Uncharacterized protein n=1 Tax=Steinernema hermaphroditum TaxID=289476 RepID=A0AA39M089_9BILA|nr:hypothetical protein QR680_012137 [Steinernema hermaphroditum]